MRQVSWQVHLGTANICCMDNEVLLKVLERAANELERAQEQRDDAILRAHRLGMPMRKIGRHVGLTGTAVAYRLARMGVL